MAKSRSKLKGSVDQNAHPKWLQKSKDGSSPKSFSGWMEREEFTWIWARDVSCEEQDGQSGRNSGRKPCT